MTLAIGGWNDSQGDKYSRLVNNAKSRRKFIDHVLKFIEKHGFDGLDLDWEYPGNHTRKSVVDEIFFCVKLVGKLIVKKRDTKTSPASHPWCQNSGRGLNREDIFCRQRCLPARRSLMLVTMFPAWRVTSTGLL